MTRPSSYIEDLISKRAIRSTLFWAFQPATFWAGTKSLSYRALMLHSHDKIHLSNLNIYLETDHEPPNGAEDLNACLFINFLFEPATSGLPPDPLLMTP